jgi:hypothetical protein
MEENILVQCIRNCILEKIELDPSMWFIPSTLLCLSLTRKCISKAICCGHFLCVCFVYIGGIVDCLNFLFLNIFPFYKFNFFRNLICLISKSIYLTTLFLIIAVYIVDLFLLLSGQR